MHALIHPCTDYRIAEASDIFKALQVASSLHIDWCHIFTYLLQLVKNIQASCVTQVYGPLISLIAKSLTDMNICISHIACAQNGIVHVFATAILQNKNKFNLYNFIF